MSTYTREEKSFGVSLRSVITSRIDSADNHPEIASVTREEAYGLVIYFTDGTFAQYAAQELLALRPYRETTVERSSREMKPFLTV